EVYLSRQFEVIKDHKALQWLFTLKKPKKRLHMWAVELSTYPMKIIHKEGSKQQHVDALSRAPIAMHLTSSELIDAQKADDLTYVKSPVIKHGITTVNHNGIHKAVVPESLRP